MQVAEMRTIWYMNGVSWKDRISNEYIRTIVWIVDVRII